jgi:hypothetical protein
MYRYFKRIKNSVKEKFAKDKPLVRESVEDLDTNPEFMSAVTVFSNRLEDRNISSIKPREENVN